MCIVANDFTDGDDFFSRMTDQQFLDYFNSLPKEDNVKFPMPEDCIGRPWPGSREARSYTYDPWYPDDDYTNDEREMEEE